MARAALGLLAAGLVSVAAQPDTPSIVGAPVVLNDTLQPGVRLRINIGTGARFRVVARPFEVETNFTNGLPSNEWYLDTNGVAVGAPSGPSTDPPVGSPVAGSLGNKVRLSVPLACPGTATVNCYDMWNFRGTAPYLLRREELVGSWSMEAFVDASSVNLNGGPSIVGLVIHEAGYSQTWGVPGGRLTYHIWPGGEPHLTCDYFGQGGVCGTSRIPGGVKRAWMRIAYDVIEGTYTMMYKFVESDEWAVQAIIREEIMPSGGKIQNPRAGFFIKAWGNPHVTDVDFSQFRLTTNLGRWAKHKAFYFTPAQITAANSASGGVFIPLPRYVLYRLAVQAIDANGLTSPEEASRTGAVLVGPANPPPLPQTLIAAHGMPTVALDMSAQVVVKNAQFLNGSWGTATAFQGGSGAGDAQRPRIAVGVQYDRQAMICSGDKFTTIANSAAPPQYSATDMSATGYTLMVVARADPTSAQGMMISKGTGTEATQGFALTVNAGLSSLGIRVVQPPAGSNRGAQVYNSTVDSSQVNLWTYRLAPSGVGSAFNILGRLNGGMGNWTAGGLGTALGAGTVNGPIRPNAAPFRLCSDESATRHFQGAILDVYAFPTALSDASTAQLEGMLLAKHYLTCPPLTPDYTPGTFATPAAATPCGTGVPGSVCSQVCPANMSLVSGSADHTCARGVWRGRTAVCGAVCPRLLRPDTAVGCSRVMHFESFSVGDLYNDTAGVSARRPPTNGGNLSSTLARYAVFPNVPDSAVSDIFNIVPSESAAAELAVLPPTPASYDRGTYDAAAVWRARDELVNAGVTPRNSSSGSSGTGLLTAYSYRTPNESPYGGGYVLFPPAPSWAVDSSNNPSQGSYWYSTRVRPVSDVAGVAFRISTGTGAGYLAPASTSYYVAAIDIEASDVRRDVDNVVTLAKVTNGVYSVIDGRTWSTIVRQSGIEVNRGRWYTLSARVTQLGIALWLIDDATGNGTQVLASPDSSVPFGGLGLFVAGAAQFDDLRVNSSCAVDGSASGMTSNTATAVGGMVQHMCPPAYRSTGSRLRVCGDDGMWTGTPLVCAPPPPVWQRSSSPGDGMAVNADAFPWFNRTVREDVDANAPVLGGSPLTQLPIAANPAGGTSTPLDVLYKIPTLVDGVADNGNVDNSTGLAIFSIDTCGGQIRVRNPQVLDFYRKPSYNITVWAYVIGEANSVGFVQGNVVINLIAINRPPVLADTIIYVREGLTPGTYVNTQAGGPIVAFDREGTPAMFAIDSGNELGLFTLGPRPPLVPATAGAGQLAMAASVNAGLYPGTQFCACRSLVTNFEGTPSRYNLRLKVMDGRDNSLFTYGTVTVIVNDTNDQPFQYDAQLRTVVDTSSAPGSTIGSPLSALDEDAGDALTWSIQAMWGGSGADGGANMPVIPAGAWPVTVVGATGQLQMNPALPAFTWNPALPPRTFQGFATRAIFRMSVRVTDRAGASDTKNQTVVVLANITSGGVTGTIMDFLAPSGGLSTAGGEVVTVIGDYLPTTARRFFASYTTSLPGDPTYVAECNLTVPVSGVPEPGMTMACVTAPGVGAAHSWSFSWVNAANATVDIPASGTTQAITSYRAPSVAFLTAPTNGTNTTNSLTLRTAGRLLIDLRAIDYVPGLWDNRATSGAVSQANGDFGVSVGAPAPTAQNVAGVPAVVFSNAIDGVNKALSTLASPGSNVNMFNGIYDRSDWSWEVWFYGYNVFQNAEQPLVQWGRRPSPACTSGFLSSGHHPIWGSGGYYDCDHNWAVQNPPQPASTGVITSNGANTYWGPTQFAWHHGVWTYSGNSGPGAIGNVSVYLDGVQILTQQRSLNIAKPSGSPSLIHLGNWMNDNLKQYYFATGVALGAVRAHDGALTAADVSNNFAAERAQYNPVATSRVVDPDNLDTAGAQLVVLNGANYGPSFADVSVTYQGPNPLGSGLITYTATVFGGTHSTLLVRTQAGVGRGLTFQVTVGRQMSPASGQLASYALPVITTLQASALLLNRFPSVGGSRITLLGTGFGPLSLPGQAATYLPVVSYGGADGRSILATGCSRAAATAFTTITCNTAPGGGAGHRFTVCLGTLATCGPLSLPSINITYEVPTVTLLSGATRMKTSGGESLVAQGTGFGTVAQNSAGLYAVTMQWGFPPSNWLYTGVNCALQPSGATTQVVCTTPPGMGGRGLAARVQIVGPGYTLTSNTFTGTALQFAEPVISAFSGPGSVEGSTGGGVEVIVDGDNFGMAGSQWNVSYTLALKDSVPGVTTPVTNTSFAPNVVVYVPANCSLAIPHRRLSCFTTAGAGAALAWTVTVNNVTNVAPTTSYAAPAVTTLVVTNALNVPVASGVANTDGGEVLQIQGSGFGVTSRTPNGAIRLLQRVSLVSRGGVSAPLPMSAVTLISDRLIRVVIPPGSGAGWRVQVRVADRDSPISTVGFSYAQPRVTSIDCWSVASGVTTGLRYRGKPSGGFTCFVNATNLALNDPDSEVVVLFGNAIDGSLAPSALRASPVFRPDTDNITGTRFVPGRVSFSVPPGLGLGRSVRLVTYRAGDPIPNPSEYAALLPQTQTCGGTGVSSQTCTGIDLFSYLDPAITLVVVNRPAGADLTAATGLFPADVPPASIRMLRIYGSNFGSGTFGTSSTLFRDVEVLRSNGTWEDTPADLKFDPTRWTDGLIVAYTTNVPGNIRVAIRSASWAGTLHYQRSNQMGYFDYNPTVTVVNPGPFPCTGLSPGGAPALVTFRVQYLSPNSSITVTVGGRACQLVDQSGLDVAPNEVTTMLANPSYYTPAGIITPNTIWNLRCQVPRGQGLNVPLVVTRVFDGAASSLNVTTGTEAYTIDYIAPRIAQIAVINPGEGATAQTGVFQPNIRYVVHPDGSSQVTLGGNNLGVCPVLTIGTYTLAYCGAGCAASCIANGFEQPGERLRNATLTPDLETLTFSMPPGEGDGVLQTGTPDGWAITVSAGGQTQTTGAIRFGYAEPDIFRLVTSNETASFPTRGGPRITIVGRNFGVPMPGYSQVALSLYLRTRVYFGSGAWSDPIDSGAASNCVLQGTVNVCTNATSICRTSIGSNVTACTDRDFSGSSWRACANVVRINDTAIECDLPEGSGASLRVLVSAAGMQGLSDAPLLTYNRPAVDSMTLILNYTEYTADMALLPTLVDPEAIANLTGKYRTAIAAAVAESQTTLRGPSAGGYHIRVDGRDFGPDARLVASSGCIFVSWPRRISQALVCDGMETAVGEGEVWSGHIVAWSHESVIFRVPPGMGRAQFTLQAGGQAHYTPDRAQSEFVYPRFFYEAPRVTALTPARGPTRGGTRVVITGANFGAGTPMDFWSGNYSYPMRLPLMEGWLPPMKALRVNWGPTLGNRPAGSVSSTEVACISNSWTFDGQSRAPYTSACLYGTVDVHTHDRLEITTLPGVGAAIDVSVSIFETDNSGMTSVEPVKWAYNAPRITAFEPSIMTLGRSSPVDVYVTGDDFGGDTSAYPDAVKDQLGNLFKVELLLSNNTDYCSNAQAVERQGDARKAIKCSVDANKIPVGYHNATVFVAAQTGFLPENDTAALLVACQGGFFGYPGEPCRPCPAYATCDGFLQGINVLSYRLAGFERLTSPANLSNVDRRGLGVHTYPRPAPGFFNLNSSDRLVSLNMFGACPDKFKIGSRDVCIAPCDPADACLGDNFCSTGYVSKAPMFRCSSCEKGFFKRNGECIRCPDSPYMLVIGFIALVIVAASAAYLLNKKNINLGFLSIGLDFFQVLAMFANAKVSWPPVIKELFHILSAFNLNIEIVAPECLMPDVSYVQKFIAIICLPLAVGFIFLCVHFGLIMLKLIKGRRKNLTRHSGALASSGLMLFYVLYIYLCKTTFDVFNCGPLNPDDGKEYLQVVFEECGKPGGTQVTLIPLAVAALALYIFGYPATVAWIVFRNRFLMMEDQLLRAKGVGHDRLTNPNAYDVRKRFSRVYFQYKPDYVFWALAILFRKFCIALVSLFFNRNAAFQLAACIIVLFVSYTFHVRYMPYLSPADGDKVIRAHVESSYTSLVHARLRARLAGIESRSRKRAHRNVISATGKIDAGAVLGVLTNWLFNYNTVEQLLLAAAIVVCLMGVMYDSSRANTVVQFEGNSTNVNRSRDAITSVVLATVILSIVYFFSVIIVEIVVLWNEESARKRIARARAKGTSKSHELDKELKERNKRQSSQRNPMAAAMKKEGKVTGATDMEFNPSFIAGGAPGGSGGWDASASISEAVLSSTKPPPQELWSSFQQAFMQQQKALELMQERIISQAVMAGENDAAARGGSPMRTAFNPTAAGGGASSRDLEGDATPARGAPGASLAGYASRRSVGR